MLICHCNLLTGREVEAAIRKLLEEDPWQLIVPAKVYHAMGRRGRCCNCFPDIVEAIIRVTEGFHADRAGETEPHLQRVRDLRGRFVQRGPKGRKC